MTDVVILCNGEFPRKAYPLYLLERAEAVVCCDGAAVKYLRKFGEKRMPEVVIGDMDSLPRRLREKLAPIIVPVEEQDYNDMTKAMRYVLAHHPDVTDIHILGATGLREDHTVGNLGLLMEYARMFDLTGIRVEMVSDYSTAFAITDSCELHVGKAATLNRADADIVKLTFSHPSRALVILD